MAKNNNLTDFLTELADVIRDKFALAGMTINPQDFTTWINKLNAKAYQIVDKSVTDLTSTDLYGATKIGKYTFYQNKSLTSCVMPSTVTDIETYAFYQCSNLSSVTIPNSVTSIGARAFYNCDGLTSVTIPDSVTSFSDYVFYKSIKLKNVTIGNGVTSIGSSSFRYCSALQTVNIGSGVTKIGSYALQCGATGAKTTFTITATTPPTIMSNTFDTSCINKIYVPTTKVSTYKSATNWSSLSSYIYDGGF